MGKYFDKFPLVEYDGKLARNILVNVDFTERTKKDIYSNFDYVISDNLYRPDALSNVNYNSPYYDWLVYFSNNVVDPYHDVYLSEQDLQKFIIGKYGSIAKAQTKVLYYRNNWAPDDSELKTAIYDNLHSDIQKYYKPKINNFNQVVAYERKKEDWIQSTNKLIKLEFTAPLTGYTIGDKYIAGDASGFIVGFDDKFVTIQHIVGIFVTSATIVSVTELIVNIPSIESTFWAQVTAYDYELENNEIKKHINLIKNSYLPDIEKKFQAQLK